MATLSAATIAAIREAVAEAMLEAAAVNDAAPVAPVADPVANTFATEVIAGSHPCTAEPPCGRILKTAQRAAHHGGVSLPSTDPRAGHRPAK